jgi:hypothetical protein
MKSLETGEWGRGTRGDLGALAPQSARLTMGGQEGAREGEGEGEGACLGIMAATENGESVVTITLISKIASGRFRKLLILMKRLKLKREQSSY